MIEISRRNPWKLKFLVHHLVRCESELQNFCTILKFSLVIRGGRKNASEKNYLKEREQPSETFENDNFPFAQDEGYTFSLYSIPFNERTCKNFQLAQFHSRPSSFLQVLNNEKLYAVPKTPFEHVVQDEGDEEAEEEKKWEKNISPCSRFCRH